MPSPSPFAPRRRSLCLVFACGLGSACTPADDDSAAGETVASDATAGSSTASGGATAGTGAATTAAASSGATSEAGSEAGSDSGASEATSASASGTATAGSASATDTTTAATGTDTTAGDEDLVMEAEDFTCITTMTPVRSYYVANPLGRLDETLAVANSADGGRFPVGTVLQLVPTEAMVKRRAGFDPSTNDWEFFSLGVTASGTRILDRGAATVVNAFGGNCLDCHAKAEPQWDLICEQTHGCDPLPLTTAQIRQIQAADPRCP